MKSQKAPEPTSDRHRNHIVYAAAALLALLVLVPLVIALFDRLAPGPTPDDGTGRLGTPSAVRMAG